MVDVYEFCDECGCEVIDVVYIFILYWFWGEYGGWKYVKRVALFVRVGDVFARIRIVF